MAELSDESLALLAFCEDGGDPAEIALIERAFGVTHVGVA